MSVESAKKFMEVLGTDAELQEKMSKIVLDASAKASAAFATSMGYECSAEDYAEALKENPGPGILHPECVSNENIRKLQEVLAKDEELQYKYYCETGKDVIAALAAAAKEVGYEFTAEEFNEAANKEIQLSPEDLEKVSGGMLPDEYPILFSQIYVPLRKK